MVERLTIARLGRRGDGIADTSDGAAFVPFALPGETVAVERSPGHPDRRQLIAVETRARSGSRRSVRISASAGAARLSLGPPPTIATGSALWSSRRCRRPASSAGGRLIDAHGEGRRRTCCTPAAAARRAQGRLRGAARAPHRRHRPLPDPGARARRRAAAAWAIAEAIETHAQAARHPDHRDRDGLDVDVRGSGPLAAAATGAGARWEQHRLARLTRHGEMWRSAHRRPSSMGRARVALPPGAFLQATAAGEATLAALVAGAFGAPAIADLFAGVGPFALRLAERARVTAVDGDKRRDRRAQARRRDQAGPKAGRGRSARPLPPPAVRPS